MLQMKILLSNINFQELKRFTFTQQQVTSSIDSWEWPMMSETGFKCSSMASKTHHTTMSVQVSQLVPAGEHHVQFVWIVMLQYNDS